MTNYFRFHNLSSAKCEQHPLDLSILRKVSDVKQTNSCDQNFNVPPTTSRNTFESSTSNDDNLHLALSSSLTISSPRRDPASNTYWPSGASLQSSFGYVKNPHSELFCTKSLQMNSKEVVQLSIPDRDSLSLVNSSESAGSSASTITTSCGRRRKKIPQRSAKKFDPAFHGVSFLMRTKLNENYESSLAITASFKLPKPMRTKKKRVLIRRSICRSFSPSDSLSEGETFDTNSSSSCAPSTSSSGGGFSSSFRSSLCSSSSSQTSRSVFGPDQGFQDARRRRQQTSGFDGSQASGSGYAVVRKRTIFSSDPLGKQCASCETRKTPLWRDAEDGTPLCNACGIRYKKYRVRCGHCWRVPKKDTKWTWICVNCGHSLRASPAVKTKGW